jgi:hypothetical protein
MESIFPLMLYNWMCVFTYQYSITAYLCNIPFQLFYINYYYNNITKRYLGLVKIHIVGLTSCHIHSGIDNMLKNFFVDFKNTKLWRYHLEEKQKLGEIFKITNDGNKNHACVWFLIRCCSLNLWPYITKQIHGNFVIHCFLFQTFVIIN